MALSYIRPKYHIPALSRKSRTRMISPYSRYEQSLRERSMTAVALLVLAGLFAIAGSVVAWHYLRPVTAGAKKFSTPIQPDSLLHLKFNDADFYLPAGLISSINRTTFRKVRQINLAIPLDWYRNRKIRKLTQTSNMSNWVLANIKVRKSFVGTKQWLGTIYRQYVSGPAQAHSSGLIRYGFKPDSPYADMEIFTDNLKKPGFIIRCELVKTTLPIRLCEQQIRLDSHFIISYRFARSHLTDWQKIHRTITTVMKGAYKKNGI